METKIKTAQEAKNQFFNLEITLEELIERVNRQIIPANYTPKSRTTDEQVYRILLPYHIDLLLMESLKIECEREWDIHRIENVPSGNFILMLEFKKEA